MELEEDRVSELGRESELGTVFEPDEEFDEGMV
jgi:hypothetical protein